MKLEKKEQKKKHIYKETKKCQQSIKLQFSIYQVQSTFEKNVKTMYSKKRVARFFSCRWAEQLGSAGELCVFTYHLSLSPPTLWSRRVRHHAQVSRIPHRARRRENRRDKWGTRLVSKHAAYSNKGGDTPRSENDRKDGLEEKR